jgi:hypothetical protein
MLSSDWVRPPRRQESQLRRFESHYIRVFGTASRLETSSSPSCETRDALASFIGPVPFLFPRVPDIVLVPWCFFLFAFIADSSLVQQVVTTVIVDTMLHLVSPWTDKRQVEARHCGCQTMTVPSMYAPAEHEGSALGASSISLAKAQVIHFGAKFPHGTFGC